MAQVKIHTIKIESVNTRLWTLAFIQINCWYHHVNFERNTRAGDRIWILYLVPASARDFENLHDED
jgi:hypothetical protein